MDQVSLSAISRARAALAVVDSRPTGTPFSLGAMLRSMRADEWDKVSSVEKQRSDALAALHGGQLNTPNGWTGIRIPASVLHARDLSVSPASAGGYLAPVQNRDDLYLPALQGNSVALTLGAQVVAAGPGGITIPRGTTGVTTMWLSTETTQATESTPAFGQAAGTPKILSAYCEVSRQLLLQSNADEILARELRRAAGAALDSAVIQGSGAAGQPTGIVNTASVGGFTGASLNQAALRDAQADVLEANASVGGRLGFATTPTVAEILSTRQRFTGSDRALWEGSLADGVLEGERALSTTNCPASTAVFGDWSTVYVAEWSGGLAIQVDPFTKFAQGIIGVRLLLAVDVIVSRAAAWSVATSVS